MQLKDFWLLATLYGELARLAGARVLNPCCHPFRKRGWYETKRLLWSAE
ncbi:hypothetical protein CDAR_416681, partial [Caerostris darwini]